MMTSYILIILLLTSSLLVLPLFTAFKFFLNREMISSFECGFDPYHSSRIPFSLQFFMITVIFLIFDIEITILLPSPLMSFLNSPMMYFMVTMSFIVILLGGTYYEWYKGALNWVN